MVQEHQDPHSPFPPNAHHTTSVYATQAEAQAMDNAMKKCDRALALKRQGNYTEAERLYLEALQTKLSTAGEDHISTASNRNALGELYSATGRLDEAVDQLQKAIDWRKTKGPATDCAVSVENLAQVWEAKGDLGKALETRVGHNVHQMVCGNYECPGALFQKANLKTCGRCKAVFYCGARCQKIDWKTRHKKYCKVPSEL